MSLADLPEASATATGPSESRLAGFSSSPIVDPVAAVVRRLPRKRGRVIFALAVTWLVGLSLAAILADWLPLKDYSEPSSNPRQPPGFRWPEPLGTDNLGRSQLSRLIYGARVSLSIGLASVAIGMFVGGLIGLAAGFFRAKTDSVSNVLLDTILAFPPLVFLLAVTAAFDPSLPTLIIALAILSIPSYARLARANTLSIAQREFVLAARSIGALPRRILFREVLPNVVFPVASFAFVIMAAVIVAEGSLSFLGLGIPAPQPSWGGMVASGRQFLATDPYLVFVPAITLLITVYSFNVVGDRVRRRFDSREAAL